jgi:iron complex outermembrane receptor protein
MTTKLPIALAVGAALSAGAASPAMAQTTADDPKAGSIEQELETVTVTGSRIRRSDYVSDSPVVTVAASALGETGSTAMEHLLNTLPQFVPSVTTTPTIPGTAARRTSTCAGSERTGISCCSTAGGCRRPTRTAPST